jgi:ABC-type multidrug transport system ATPase subunit
MNHGGKTCQNLSSSQGQIGMAAQQLDIYLRLTVQDYLRYARNMSESLSW